VEKSTGGSWIKLLQNARIKWYKRIPLTRYLESSFTESVGQEAEETRLTVNMVRLLTAGKEWEDHEPITFTRLLMITKALDSMLNKWQLSAKSRKHD